MAQRYELVQDYLAEVESMTELCRQYGISRRVAYKWVARFEAEGRDGLADRSRRPHQVKPGVPLAMRQAILAARRRHPEWGARKLRAWLVKRDARPAWPARSTIHDVCHAAELVRAPRWRIPAAPIVPTRLRRADAPNAVWTVDFKGHFRLGTGAQCYPLTLRDAASRFTLRCDALSGERTADTRARFERAFTTYGVPACIRSDNGKPFAGPGLARLSALNVWWLRLGIAVEQIALGRPDQNGSHEQFHRVLKARTARPPAVPSRPNNAGSIGFGANTTKTGRTRRWTMTCPRRTISRHLSRTLVGCPLSSMRPTGTSAVCGPAASCPGAMRTSFSARPCGVKRSPLKKWMTVFGPSTSAAFRSHVGMSANAACG